MSHLQIRSPSIPILQALAGALTWKCLVSPASKTGSIIVNGEVEVTKNIDFGSFPRDGSVTLLAADHASTGKTEDLKGSISDFKVYSPPLSAAQLSPGWGWPLVLMLAGGGLIYGSVGSAMARRSRGAGGGPPQHGARRCTRQHLPQYRHINTE